MRRRIEFKCGLKILNKKVADLQQFALIYITISGPQLCLYTVKPLITNPSKEFIKCRILHFPILECCRYLVF